MILDDRATEITLRDVPAANIRDRAYWAEHLRHVNGEAWCGVATAITEAGRVRVLLTPAHAIVGGSQRAPAERVRRLTDAEAIAEIICRCERDGIKPHAAAAEFVDYVANPSDADFESVRRRLCEGVKRARTKQRTAAE